MHPFFIQVAIFALSAAMGIIFVVNQVTNDSDSHVSDNATRATLFVLLGIILLIFNRSKTIATQLSTEDNKVSMLPIFFSSFMIVLCAAFFGMITCYSYYIGGTKNYNTALGCITGATLLSIFFSAREQLITWGGATIIFLIAILFLVAGIFLNKAYDDLDKDQTINSGMKSFFKDIYIISYVLFAIMIVGGAFMARAVHNKSKPANAKSEQSHNESKLVQPQPPGQ